MSIIEVRIRECVSIRARAEPPRPLDCNKHFCANRVVCDRARRGCRAHEEAEGGSAPSNHVARWYNHFPRSCASSSCCGNMLSGIIIMSCACLRDHLGGLGAPVGRSARYVDQIPTQYDHGEGSEGLESHIRRSARFLFPRRHVGKTASRSTSRVVRVCQTWPRASRSRPGSVWSGWAKQERQRTMYMDTSPAACQGQSMHPPLRRRPVRRRCFSFAAVSPSDRGMITF